MNTESHTLRELRNLGYAVAIFNPDELQGADPGHISDLMVERGNEMIETLAVERTPPLEAAFNGQFMQPDIYEGHYFEVETTSGTWVVPSDLIGDLTDVDVSQFLAYIEGEPLDTDTTLNAKAGWLARLSAPGYMDCTDWTAHETLQEATDYLIETYVN